MDLEQAKEDCSSVQPIPTATPPSQSNLPKQRAHGSKQKNLAQEGVKPRPRPRYTDKARKNTKNKRDKAGAAQKGLPVGSEDVGEIKDSDNKPDVKEEQLQDPDVQANGHSVSTGAEEGVNSELEATSLQGEQGKEESWDTLFNDDGDFLDPHLLSEVRKIFTHAHLPSYLHR